MCRIFTLSSISRLAGIVLVGSVLFSTPNQLGNVAARAQGASLGNGPASLPQPGVPAINPANLAFQQVASGLSSPVFVTNAGDGSGRLFILEKAGRIRIVKNGALLSQPFLDISSIVKSTNSEQGLLGLAFHPSYASNGYFYVAYTATRPSDSVGSILTLARYTVSTDPDVASSASASVLLTIQHPSQGNHNGGMLAFGPDGYLYWSTGDGGSGGDPPNNAQNLGVLLGKLLRLDVDSASPYAAPSSNPFFSSPNANTKLIWAYGLRNSWRYSFDRLTGDLYIGDVGQSAWEEVDFQPAGDPGGENYGWRLMEGFHCYNPSTNCDPLNVTTLPVTEYGHSPECAITGGYVYRGSNFPALYGRYFYGDYCSGKVWSLYNDGGWTVEQLVDTPYSISSFGQDEAGDLYLVDLGGSVYRIVYQAHAVSTSISSSLMSSTDVVTGQTIFQSFLGRLDGPVKVKDENGAPIFTSQVVLSGPGNSFNETMGYPVDQFTTDYWFPWYDHGYPVVGGDNVRTWILVGNPSAGATAHVNIYIGEALQLGSPFSIAPGSRVTPRWIGTIGGPVHVSSDIPVFASERVFTVPDNSFSEMMGYPANQFTTEYWFPWYELDQHGHEHQGGQHEYKPDGGCGHLHREHLRGVVHDPARSDDLGELCEHAGWTGAGGVDQRHRHCGQPVDALGQQQQLQ